MGYQWSLQSAPRGPWSFLAFLVVLAGPIAPSTAPADAIVRTQAMLVSTIAEYFVDDEAVTLDLEIGVADVEAFANLLPDEIHQRLGNSPTPLRERIVRFFGADRYNCSSSTTGSQHAWPPSGGAMAISDRLSGQTGLKPWTNRNTSLRGLSARRSTGLILHQDILIRFDAIALPALSGSRDTGSPISQT